MYIAPEGAGPDAVPIRSVPVPANELSSLADSSSVPTGFELVPSWIGRPAVAVWTQITPELPLSVLFRLTVPLVSRLRPPLATMGALGVWKTLLPVNSIATKGAGDGAGVAIDVIPANSVLLASGTASTLIAPLLVNLNVSVDE